eukprot:tig00000144_g9064.t1
MPFNTLKPAALTPRESRASHVQALSHARSESTALSETVSGSLAGSGLPTAALSDAGESLSASALLGRGLQRKNLVPSQAERRAEKHRKANAGFWQLWEKLNPGRAPAASQRDEEGLVENAGWPFVRADPHDFIAVLEADPTGLKFCFAVRFHADKFRASWNPYELRLVTKQEAEGQERYYTVSPGGVTEVFRGAAREHLSRAAWEAERALFAALVARPVFPAARRMRFFKAWRHFVAGRKRGRAAAALTAPSALLAEEKLRHLRPLLALFAECGEAVGALGIEAPRRGAGVEVPDLAAWSEEAAAQIAAHGARLQGLAAGLATSLAVAIRRRMEEAHNKLLADRAAAAATAAALAAAFPRGPAPCPSRKPPVPPSSAAPPPPPAPPRRGPAEPERLAAAFSAAAAEAQSPARPLPLPRSRSETPPRPDAFLDRRAPGPVAAGARGGAPLVGDGHISDFLKGKGPATAAPTTSSPRAGPARPPAPGPSPRTLRSLGALDLSSGPRLAALAPLPSAAPAPPPAPLEEGLAARSLHAEVALARAVCADSLSFVKRGHLALADALLRLAPRLLADLAAPSPAPPAPPQVDPELEAEEPPAEEAPPAAAEEAEAPNDEAAAPASKKKPATRRVGRAFIVERAPSRASDADADADAGPEGEAAPAAPSPTRSPPPRRLRRRHPHSSYGRRPGSRRRQQATGPDERRRGTRGGASCASPPTRRPSPAASTPSPPRAPPARPAGPRLTRGQDVVRAIAAVTTPVAHEALAAFYRLAAHEEREELPPFDAAAPPTAAPPPPPPPPAPAPQRRRPPRPPGPGREALRAAAAARLAEAQAVAERRLAPFLPLLRGEAAGPEAGAGAERVPERLDLGPLELDLRPAKDAIFARLGGPTLAPRSTSALAEAASPARPASRPASATPHEGPLAVSAR